MKKLTLLLTIFMLSVGVFAQEAPPIEVNPPVAGGSTTSSDPQVSGIMDGRRANAAEKNGIEVEIKSIARFRGVRKNQILGYGLVVGLEGTGDTKKTPFTAT